MQHRVTVRALLGIVQDDMKDERMDLRAQVDVSEHKFRHILLGLGYRYRKIGNRAWIYEKESLIQARRMYLK